MSLAMFVTGCATTEPAQIKTRTIYATPPESLYPVCPKPSITIQTNGDLARAYRAAIQSIESCNKGIDALRAYNERDDDSRTSQ